MSIGVEVWLTSRHCECNSNKMVLDGVLISEASTVQYCVGLSGSRSNETRALPSIELYKNYEEHSIVHTTKFTYTCTQYTNT